MIGIALHSRSAPADLDPVAVGQHEVDDRRVGRLDRGAVERLLGGRRRDDLEARVAQHDPQRAQDLRLVVDRRARARCARSRRREPGSGSGSSTTKLVALAGQRLDVHAAAVGLDEALARSRARAPSPGRRAASPR